MKGMPAAVAAIAAAALALRLWGIGFGLPQLYHPDEPAYVLQALAVGRGLPNGLTFANPPLFKYLLLAEYAATYALERLAGVSHSPGEFVEEFRRDPSLLYLEARATNAVLGTLTVLAAMALAASVAGRRAALIAGGLCAVAYLLVREAHFGVDDTLVSLLVALGLIACVQVSRRGLRRDYVAAGAVAGLAFAAKYDGIAVLAPLTLAHVLRRQRARDADRGRSLHICQDPRSTQPRRAGQGFGHNQGDEPSFAQPRDADQGRSHSQGDDPSFAQPRGADPGWSHNPGDEPSLAQPRHADDHSQGDEPSFARPRHADPSGDHSQGDEPSFAQPRAYAAIEKTPTVRERFAADLALGLAAAACIVAALVAFPSLLSEPGRVLNDIYLHLWVDAQHGYDGLDASGGYVFYARALAVGLGWPLLLAAVAGLGVSVNKRGRAGLVVASLPVAMLLVLGSQQLYFARFLLPIVPALVVAASLALDALFARQAVLGGVALLLVMLPTLVDAVRFDALLGQTDTRSLAANWMPGNAVYAADAPPLGPPLLAEHNVASDVDAIYERGLDDYRARGADYLVVSSFVTDARAVDPAREARRRSFVQELAGHRPVAEFSPGDVAFAYDQLYAPYDGLDRLERPGPKISIYRLTREIAIRP